MSEKIDIFEELTLPLIPLRGLVGFPAVQLNIEIVRPISLKAFTAAATLYDAKILLVAQKDIATASAVSSGFGGFFSFRIEVTIAITCCFSALP